MIRSAAASRLTIEPAQQNISAIYALPCNHLRINEERGACDLPPLVRSSTLDEVARTISRTVAERGAVPPGDAEGLAVRILRGRSPSATFFDSNLGCFRSTRATHVSFMMNVEAKEKMLDSGFSEMGIGTSSRPDGLMIVCQMFRGDSNNEH